MNDAHQSGLHSLELTLPVSTCSYAGLWFPRELRLNINSMRNALMIVEALSVGGKDSNARGGYSSVARAGEYLLRFSRNSEISN